MSKKKVVEILFDQFIFCYSMFIKFELTVMLVLSVLKCNSFVRKSGPW